MEFQPCQFYCLPVCGRANSLAHDSDLATQESATTVGHALGISGSSGDGGRDGGALGLEDFMSVWIVSVA